MTDTKAAIPRDPDRQPILIRAHRPDDAEAIAAMRNQHGFCWGTLGLPYRTAESVRAYIERRGATGTYLVATVGGEIAGAASLDPGKDRRAHVGGLGMGVADVWTGRGVGAALMGALVDVADNWLGLRRLELTVFTDNAPAIRLYRKSVFILEGTHRAFALRGGRHVDAYCMARLRGPA